MPEHRRRDPQHAKAVFFKHVQMTHHPFILMVGEAPTVGFGSNPAVNIVQSANSDSNLCRRRVASDMRQPWKVLQSRRGGVAAANEGHAGVYPPPEYLQSLARSRGRTFLDLWIKRRRGSGPEGAGPTQKATQMKAQNQAAARRADKADDPKAGHGQDREPNGGRPDTRVGRRKEGV
ncbi:hypothetical protein B0H19DRAFT_1083263 [Mycena capillaripes]|nr:hypothetical protein B0H19DRAFT_1083263 [Mycena capillaripes]